MSIKSTKACILATTSLFAVLAASNVAAQTQPQTAPANDDANVVVVTGYRGSLRNATTAKKNAVNFTETVFSEDIGKFPDLNMAEALQRVPGMIVTRDAFSGDGTQIVVRALPSNFTQVTMNGGRIAMATDNGISGSSSTNRQVDLDAFPTGLFTRVDVSKTPSADQLEGGIAGTVNLQNARPFDRKGHHGAIAIQGNYNANSKETSPRLTAVWSKTWDKFGVLAGVSLSEKNLYTSGFETLGYGDPNFNNYCGTCDPGLTSSNGVFSNLAGSNQWVWGQTVYNWTGNGLTPGTLNEAGLLALNPGMTRETMKGALMPRLGRNSILNGTSTNKVGLIALEYRPSDTLRFNLDILGGGGERDAERSNMMLAFRSTGPTDDYNRGMIPLNMKVDENNVVTSAKFAHSTFFLESNAYQDRNAYLSVNGGFDWKFGDEWSLDGQVGIMRSTYERGVFFLKYRTPFESNVTATYVNDSANQDLPTITSNVDLNDPNIGWRTFGGGQMILQRDKRNATTTTAHVNIAKGFGDWTFKGGWAIDSYQRNINIGDLSPALRTAYAAAIPESEVKNYLTPMTDSIFGGGVTGGGFDRFVLPNFDKIKDAIDYDALIKSAPVVSTGGSYNGAGAATIQEEISSAYGMAIYNGELFSIPFKTNFGYRFQTTNQTVTAPSVINSQIVYLTTNARYKDVLPSFNAVAAVTPKLNVRVAASKTMTRANPADMTSSLTLDTSASSGSRGNPNLKPFYSNNFDIGGEYYTGRTGYVGFTYFKKDITGFIARPISPLPFSALGVDYASLNTNQQQGLANALIPATSVAQVLATPSLVANVNVNITQPVNSDKVMKLTGQEYIWVQPLDNFVEGLGFTANYTAFDVTPADLALGIPKNTYNVTGYYEDGPISFRLSYVNVSVVKTGFPIQANNIALDAFNRARSQIDLSASYKFKAFGLDQSLTLDATNLTSEGFKSYYTYENITTGFQSPGTSVLLGWRAQY
ncbi:TonB-dependent receptor [Asticcacaulis biprosthecium]|nr:TonB-dependent receptor [Asticcacaulis biprosthecium]